MRDYPTIEEYEMHRTRRLSERLGEAAIAGLTLFGLPFFLFLLGS